MIGADAAIDKTQRHPTGQAVGDEHAVEGIGRETVPRRRSNRCSGVRVLDLTRVLTGPTCARTLTEWLAAGTTAWGTRSPSLQS